MTLELVEDSVHSFIVFDFLPESEQALMKLGEGSSRVRDSAT